MSGTSLDGIDMVLVSFRDSRPEFVRHLARRFPRELRARLLACASNQVSSWETAQLHHDLGRFYARATAAGFSKEHIDAIGLHGQTVYHHPAPPTRATLQLGEPAYLGEALRVPVVSNFRAMDIAAGGQGAPLATAFHVALFGRNRGHTCVQNIGGIANVTSIQWRLRARPGVAAFDTGPGNMLLDAAVERLSSGRLHCDRGGRFAAKGVPNETCLRRWMRDPYHRLKPPKSTGRERFGGQYLDGLWRDMDREALSDADRLATLTELTARSIALNYRMHLRGRPDRVILCGGGARNTHLCERLRHHLREFAPAVELIDSSALGWPVETMEAAAFAFLARGRLRRQRANHPEATGSGRAVICGQVTEP
jgi:anhydro-N-acetylmuramic acid kinase